MALVIAINRQTKIFNAGTDPDKYDPGVGLKLSVLQEEVGGFIQLITFPQTLGLDGRHYRHMILNEEGKLKELPFNPIASQIAWFIEAIGHDDCIVGNVVLLEEGEIT